MNFGLLTPLFLAGAALIAVPWLIHQIRRPERDVARFSSLLFVPEVKREVIERRRIQHWLLMLLRMLLLLLLTAAFTRPYRTELRPPISAPTRQAAHVIALDISASMGTAGQMEAAKAKAQALVAALPTSDRVAVIHFAASARVSAPLHDPNDPEAGSTARAQQAIAAARPTGERTDYLAALQAAEQLLLGPGAGNERGVVHLIGDLQQSGMPDESNWRLSGTIELKPVAVGDPNPDNRSIEDLVVRRTDDAVQIRARLRNWSSDAAATTTVELVIDGTTRDRQELTLPPRNATQVIFRLDAGAGPLVGHLQIGPDALAADNRRYFAWRPPARHRVLIAAAQTTGGDERLVQAALPDQTDSPWTIETAAVRDLTARLRNDPPDIVVATALGDAPLRDYLQRGGRLLLLPNHRTDPAPINDLLAEAGVQLTGTSAAATDPTVFTRLEWVDLDHPIFRPFRSPRFNDFSGLRFYNYIRLDLAPPARSLARFATAPAIVETEFGAGRVLLWAGGVNRDWSTLARSPRFVPLLHETLRYLAPARTTRADYTVGDRATAPPGFRHGEVLFPNGDVAALPSQRPVQRPGHLRWRTSHGSELITAVNIAAAESDPRPIPAGELAIRLGDSFVHVPRVVRDAAFTNRVHQREYGRWILVLLFGLLLAENGYAAYLARKKEED